MWTVSLMNKDFQHKPKDMQCKLQLDSCQACNVRPSKHHIQHLMCIGTYNSVIFQDTEVYVLPFPAACVPCSGSFGGGDRAADPTEVKLGIRFTSSASSAANTITCNKAWVILRAFNQPSVLTRMCRYPPQLRSEHKRGCCNHLKGLDKPLVVPRKLVKGEQSKIVGSHCALEAIDDGLHVLIAPPLPLQPVL